MLPKFTYFSPNTIQEALEIASEYSGRYSFLAGGTDLISNMKHEMVNPDAVISLKNLAELSRFELTGKGLFIGASVTITEIVERPETAAFPPLVAACLKLGSLQVRNRGTIGGNISNASPCANTITPLCVLGALVHMSSLKGERIVPIEAFLTGVKKTLLQDGELVTGITLPIQPEDARGGYMEKTRVKGPDISSASVSCLLSKKSKQARICLGSLAPVPKVIDCSDVMFNSAMSFDEKMEQILSQVRSVINPITDQRSTREYRIEIAQVYTRRILSSLFQEV